MALRSFNVTVSPEGEVEIGDMRGFSGPECERATRALEQALGDVASNRRTPEYSERERERQR